MSIEALAMAGADYIQCGIEFHEYDEQDEHGPPPYMLAGTGDEDIDDQEQKDARGGRVSCVSPQQAHLRDELIKYRLMLWAKHVARTALVAKPTRP